MKNLLLLASTLFLVSPVSAGQINSRITDSVQLTVDGPAVQTSRVGSTYSVSGSNISATTLGGLNNSATTRQLPAPPPTVQITEGTYTVTNPGQSFTFSESAFIGDTVATTQAINNNGRFNEPTIYGDTTTSAGGTAGALAGTLSPTGVPTVTAGGPGTTVIGQRTIELTVFN